MKVVTVIGARPQFIKLAPLSIEFKRRKIKEIVIHSGQHYDFNMSGNFIKELLINKPQYNLNVGSGTHGYQTSQMILSFEKLFINIKPGIVIVFGDTNTTLAAALAAVKIEIPIAHIEAGLRSFNRKMPEEINRILTDHISQWCFAPTKVAMNNLKNENIVSNAHLVGDIMYDSILLFKKQINFQNINRKYNIKNKSYFLATIHRAENTGCRKRLANILKALSELDNPVIFPVHPRTYKIIKEMGFGNYMKGLIKPVEPCSYFELLSLINYSKAVLTDSGGIQKESYFLKVPCLTLRDETEWTETVKSGWNVLISPAYKMNLKNIIQTNFHNLKYKNLFGDGHASHKICDLIFN